MAIQTQIPVTDTPTTVPEARNFVHEHRTDPGGVRCPVCDRLVVIAKRGMTASMGHALVIIYQRAQHIGWAEWIHVEELIKSAPVPAAIASNCTLPHFWDLLEKKMGERPDGSRSVGYYRMTALGRGFVEGNIAVPKTAYMYNNEVVDFSDEKVFITDLKGKGFNYREVMGL